MVLFTLCAAEGGFFFFFNKHCETHVDLVKRNLISFSVPFRNQSQHIQMTPTAPNIRNISLPLQFPFFFNKPHYNYV